MTDGCNHGMVSYWNCSQRSLNLPWMQNCRSIIDDEEKKIFFFVSFFPSSKALRSYVRKLMLKERKHGFFIHYLFHSSSLFHKNSLPISDDFYMNVSDGKNSISITKFFPSYSSRTFFWPKKKPFTHFFEWKQKEKTNIKSVSKIS